MKSQRLKFPGAFGDQLAARLDRPEGEPKAYALFAHCFTCSKDLKAVARISKALVSRGLAVFRFDFTGLGESEGDFADTNFSSNLEDLRAAIEFLRDEYRAPQLLIGHSLGGAAVLAIAGDCPEVEAVATLGAPSDTDHLRETILSSAPELEKSEEAEVELAGRKIRIRRQLLEDLEEHTLLEAVRELRRPLLIFHSPVDNVVDIEHAKRIYQAARHPKSFVSLDQADHLLLQDPADARHVAEVLASWAERYVEMGEEEALEPGGEVEEGVVRVRGGAEGFVQAVRAGHHELVGDEPADYGGTDRGPTPYDYLLTALGTCTSMTLRMYADRKKWPLEGVEVTLRHDKVHAKDCQECETQKGKIDRIVKEIVLEGGDLDEDQLDRLMEIADRCPVHRTLKSEILIESHRR